MKWSERMLAHCRAELRKMIPFRPSLNIDIMSPEWDRYMVKLARLQMLRDYLVRRIHVRKE